ncbi:polysaccharide biosynthesis tyrosine autokinase [Isoptericola sp. BMS4]|uniref:polysaccharide biosynthesis tyrosine autokinase n=1 Tax=Isoptericola sp. BMS4 TaxID=2527875 RepID=UPI0014219B55|nr:polysaccharide biosynthesis tyrosine autokinase [Isoptericola sp. BMS4]
MTVRELLHTVWAGRWLVLAAVLLVVAGTVVYLDGQETVYRSSAVVELAATRSSGDETTEVTVAAGPADVTTRRVVEPAADELGLPVAEVSGSVVAEYGSEDGATIVITAESTDPARAQDVADAVAVAYVARLGGILEDQLAQLDEQRAAQREQLGPVDAQLDKKPKDPLADAERTTIIDQYQALTVEMNTLRSLVAPGEVVQKATPATPVGLGRPVVLALAVLAGLVAGVGLAFARRGLDVRVRGAHQAARDAETPVLAELYGARRADRDFRDTGVLPVASKRATPFTEGVRELRTAIQVSTADQGRVVVVVTAADSQGPRSFIAANLAASYALSGRTTVAMSGDLRRSQLDTLLPPPGPDAGTGPHPTGIPNLLALPAPTEDMDPADFLATDRARELVESLGTQAEVVVIDAPPALAAADASILGRYATGVVLVAETGRTDRSVLAEAADRLRVNDVPLVGVALAGGALDRRTRDATTYGEAPRRRRRPRRRGAAGSEGASAAAQHAAPGDRATASDAEDPVGSGRR